MMLKRVAILTMSLFLLSPTLRADEGMWLLTMLGKKYKDMKADGLKLKPEDIYSVNNSCLKDAICTLDHGSCTGEIISQKGLMLTNHHCGYDAIQEFSSEENDYLTDGFWAMDKSKEIPVPGKSVTFLVRMEDVTSKILDGIDNSTSAYQRYMKIEENKGKIIKEATQGTHYEGEVKSFFDGNEFYLFVNETFTDVRLVGAPPSSIGKYGGDTDNWMWPRHTGDFCLFRVYAGKDNKPANYSADNVPYTPKHHLPVNISGVSEGDYAMVLGYPGSTDRYLTSYGVKLAVEKDQPARVRIRAQKLDIMKNSMDKGDKLRIMYASKYAMVSNYWKYFIGQSEQLVNNSVYDKKKKIEDDFQKWVNADEERKKRYGNVISDIAKAYEVKNKYWMGTTYLGEAVFGPDMHSFIWRHINGFKQALESGDEAVIERARAKLEKRAQNFYKDYHAPTDKRLFEAMVDVYFKDVPRQIQPDTLETLMSAYGSADKMGDNYYSNSIFANEEKFFNALPKLSVEQIEADPFVQLITAFFDAYREKTAMASQEAELNLASAKRLFVEGLRKMNPDRVYAPDANSSLRLTYGTVGGYKARDAVYYDNFTTLDGVMAKEDPNNDEFVIPDRLKELYAKKDFGRYAEDGTVRVCFISDNDITGGNSGSPVINAKGELIGCAFDGNWEAMSGDIFFETELQRTISVDIRYILFIIDKYAGATHLVDEMTLVEGKKKKKKAKAKF